LDSVIIEQSLSCADFSTIFFFADSFPP